MKHPSGCDCPEHYNPWRSVRGIITGALAGGLFTLVIVLVGLWLMAGR
jgi:type IV secretory pathway VirB2 component (pilin)